MARAQVYRGNPETKQTIIFDNFSGGINTTSIDEQVSTNEFRKLKNVELKEEGRIQNRKGFSSVIGANSIHNFLSEYNTYYYLDIVEDTYNEIGELLDPNYKLIGTITIDAVYVKNFAVHITRYLLGKEEDTNVILSLEEHLITSGDETTVKEPKLTGLNVMNYDGKNYFLINEILEGREGFVEWGELDSEGKLIATHYKKEDSYMPNIYDVLGVGNNVFSNNPQTHISEIETSLQNIIYVNLKEYQNRLNNIDKIPNNGKFTLEVYSTGSNIEVGLDLYFYYEEGADKIPIKIKELSTPVRENGLLYYDVELKDIPSDKLILLELKKEIKYGEEIPIRHTFNSFEHLRNTAGYLSKYGYEDEYYFLKTDWRKKHKSFLTLWRKKPNTYFETEQVMLENLPYEYEYMNTDPDFVTSLEKPDDSIPIMVDIRNYEGYLENSNPDGLQLINGSKLIYPTLGSIINSEYHSGSYQTEWYTILGIIYDNRHMPEGKTYLQLYTDNPELNSVFGTIRDWHDRYRIASVAYEHTHEYDMENDVASQHLHPSYHGRLKIGADSLIEIANYVGLDRYKRNRVEEITPYFTEENVLKIKVGEDEKFYKWNGGNDGILANDFELISDSSENYVLFNYITSFDVGNPDVVTPEPINFSNLKGVIIEDNLVLYGKNTILWSEPYSNVTDRRGTKQGFSYFSNRNWAALPLSMKDEIVKIAYYRGSYIIFTKESIYRLSGTLGDGSTMELVMINNEIGCVSPDSVRSINNTLIFLAETGLHQLKQSYYMDGLENVAKVDGKITGLIPYGTNYESILYNNQYLLHIKNKDGNYIKTIKQYYNIDPAGKHNPYVVDVYKQEPDLIFRMEENMYALKNGKLYVYDIGYTDFFPYEDTENIILEDYTYEVEVETPNWSLGYPVHEKKWKNVFLRIDSLKKFPMNLTIAIDKVMTVSSENYVAILNAFGEIEYIRKEDVNHLVDPFIAKSHVTIVPYADLETLGDSMALGEGELGVSVLGDRAYQIHKLNPGNKGKTIQFNFKINSPNYFALDTLSIVYKLGKMRESR